MTIVAGDKTVVLVLGMHRSGTSAVAACLEQLGVVLGRSLFVGDEWNQKGYFEEKQIVEFNDHLLATVGLRWDSVLPPGEGAVLRWADRLAAARDLLNDIFSGASVWGFKDPRMCLLSPFWQPVLKSMGIVPRLLLVLRSPFEVANSLGRRDGISASRAGWLWFTYLLGSLEYIDDSSDTCLIDFESVLHDPGRMMAGLAQWLNLEADAQVVKRFASEFISPQLSHGADASSLYLDPLVTRAYDYWRNVTTQGESVHSALRSNEWRQIKEAFERDIQPQLASVRDFFESDRQLCVLDSRLVTTSRALQTTERLALERLDRIEVLDAQLKHTSDALAFAEELALKRLELLEQGEHRGDSGTSVAELTVEMKRLAAGLMASEVLAIERLQQVERLDRELRALREALECSERLANERLAEIQQLTVGLASCEELAVGRLKHIERIDRELCDLRTALGHSEHLAFSRLAEIRALDDALKETAGALCVAEKLAFERMLELEKMRRAGD